MPEDKMTIKGRGKVGNMLKQSAADAVIRLLDSGSNRASHEMSTRGKKGRGAYGGNDGVQYKSPSYTKEGAVDSADYVSKHKRGFKGFGATGSMLKNTAANATANLINAGSDRASSEMSTRGTGIKKGRFAKGSQEAKDHMARIRAMKR
jgi:hypothetical protein